MDGHNILKAALLIINKSNFTIEVFNKYDVCSKCSASNFGDILNNQNKTIHLDPGVSELRIIDKYNHFCSLTYQFGEHGVYSLEVTETFNCMISVVTKPVFIFYPIIFLSLMIAIGSFMKLLYKHNRIIFGTSNTGLNFNHVNQPITMSNNEVLIEPSSSKIVNAVEPKLINFEDPDIICNDKIYDPIEQSPMGALLPLSPQMPTNSHVITEKTASEQDNKLKMEKNKQRLMFLDTFRGLAVILMIFFNYGGGHYTFFQHTAWNGLSIADLVFPFFVFAMGFSYVVANRKIFQKPEGSVSQNVNQLETNLPFMSTFTASKMSHLNFWKKTISRTFKLFIIGFSITNGNVLNPAKYRIMGVLQRLSLVNLMLALTFYPPMQFKTSKIKKFIQLLMPIIIVSMQFYQLFAMAPGCPRGYNGPGGLHVNSSYTNCVGGISGFVDRKILTPKHMYQTPTCQSVYKTDLPFDPEGILGSFGAALTALLGALIAKRILKHYYENNEFRICSEFLVSFLIYGLIGMILCKFSIENGWIPINKNLWSLSFTLVTSSLACMVMLILYVCIHVLNVWGGVPFNFLGKNAIILYIGHEILRNYFPFYLNFEAWVKQANFVPKNGHLIPFMHDVYATVMWVVFGWLLDRKNIYIKL